MEAAVHWPLEYFLEKKNCEASSLFGLIQKKLLMFRVFAARRAT
jgi:hypothetical protein